MKSDGWEDMEFITGRAPQGARGLKLLCLLSLSSLLRRAPQGARGLKSND